jgi:hypothetical protein
MAENRHTLPRAPSQQHHMIHPWLTTEAFSALVSEARRRNLHPDRLAAEIFEVITRDNLFSAVIDR